MRISLHVEKPPVAFRRSCTGQRFQTFKQNLRLYFCLSLVVFGRIWELGGRHVRVGGSPPVNPSHPSVVQTDRVSSHCVNVLISEDEVL